MVDERDIEGKLVAGVRDRGGLCIKLDSLFGIQDRLILLPGAKVFFVETKKPKGGRLSQMQRVRRTQIGRLGFPAIVIKNGEELTAFFERADAAG